MGKNKLINTISEYVPTIYAYTTPQYLPHDGWTKIGDTKQGAYNRIEDQLGTGDIDYKLEWELNAKFEASNETFRDYQFHAYLQKKGIERRKRTNSKGRSVNTEWFRIMPIDAKTMLYDFRADRGIIQSLGVIPYSLRDEQADAVQKTKDYFVSHDGQHPEFLWNAKPRFGKTLTAFDLCVALKAKNVLIVTNRPAIANSWYDDYVKFFGTESGYYFVSIAKDLQGKPYVITNEQFNSLSSSGDYGRIEFVSLQNLKGSKFAGVGTIEKLDYLFKDDRYGIHKGIVWDILIIDEAHEGVLTTKTETAFSNIERKYTLHLSGTPFKHLADDMFEETAIFNWTYADEQKAKAEWCEVDRSNPYLDMPKLNLLTYKLSDIVLKEAAEGADFDDDGDKESYAFDLNEFFKTNSSQKFIHEDDVDDFLQALYTKPTFPFSEDYRDELKHTVWVLKYVSSAKALAAKLMNHEFFKQYEIVIAAGDGKLVDDETVLADEELHKVAKKSFDRVKSAIADYRSKGKIGTITLSVGQLLTGITVPQWTAVMMLSNMRSAALYMQAAFRAQNPHMFNIDGKCFKKINAYVFDFDPARSLDIYESIANNLHEDTAEGKGDSDTRKQHVRELLNFFPVFAEDKRGDMIELDAEKVLSIPRAIHAQEVVRKCFMCNFLFQNISCIFAAPSVVSKILNKIQPFKEAQPVDVDDEVVSELNINDKGDVDVPEETVIGTAQNIFGYKIYEDIADKLDEAIDKIQDDTAITSDKKLEKLKNLFHVDVTEHLLDVSQNTYPKELKKSVKNNLSNKINKTTDSIVEQHYNDFVTQQNWIETERNKLIDEAEADQRYGDIKAINEEALKKFEDNNAHFKDKLNGVVDEIIDSAGYEIVKSIETEKREVQKKAIEDKCRDHLRGFTRTIPSFLMAFGDENTTLENFDSIVSDSVFEEVTRNISNGECITLDDFRFLRDGGHYIDDETGEEKFFTGHLFNPVVFNDSVREFMKKRKELANYFDENLQKDIFDYIPPQKSNLIFTPKMVVKKMVDMLETENPGCFDSPDKTFIDLYMKSGLYITEIVKRLYHSERLKQLYPDGKERLRHIFKKQVYGLAPTEIIYKIALNYILGFSEDIHIDKDDLSQHNFRQRDALPYAKDGKLQELLDELYPDK